MIEPWMIRTAIVLYLLAVHLFALIGLIYVYLIYAHDKPVVIERNHI